MISDRSHPRFRLLAGLFLLLVTVLFVAEPAHAHGSLLSPSRHDCTVCAAHQAALPGVTIATVLVPFEAAEVSVQSPHPAPLHRPSKTQFVRPPPARW